MLLADCRGANPRPGATVAGACGGPRRSPGAQTPPLRALRPPGAPVQGSLGKLAGNICSPPWVPPLPFTPHSRGEARGAAAPEAAPCPPA